MTPKLPHGFLRYPITHRALHDVSDRRPENSRAAVIAACAAGYGIEIDVQRSADDQAMVFHDYNLDRLTESTGMVRDHSAAALGRIPLRGGDESIPTLPEVMAIVAGRVPLLIEIKDQDGAMGPDVGSLERSVADALEGYTGDVAVMSFNPHSVAKMRELCPLVARGLVTGTPEVRRWGIPSDRADKLCKILDFDQTGSSFISHETVDLGHPRVAELKAAGAAVLCWTVRSPEQEAKARKIAQNITFEQYLAPFPLEQQALRHK